MDSYPSADEVFDDLGDKVLNAISAAVALTKVDLARYRQAEPGWVASQSIRGLANWIHDRLWFHLTDKLDNVPGVTLVDEEPIRELWVGTKYRLRAKRHREDDGHVSTYPTQAALDFLSQVQPALEGLERVHLITGYEWNSDSREMGAAVISLRDGKENVIWYEKLSPSAAAGSTTRFPVPSQPGPTPPVIEVEGAAERESLGGADSA
ncbi:hypothetical protein [Micromonospora sp. NPDC049645]|uniref:hypothetical protein n=1 Tax=Micromonospora sp. NPDC049645 TaxID=3155508 RepID=UPI0034129500